MPRVTSKPVVPSASPAGRGPATAAEARRLVADWSDLSASRRRDLANGLSTLVRLAGKPAEALPLDPQECLAVLERASRPR